MSNLDLAKRVIAQRKASEERQKQMEEEQLKYQAQTQQTVTIDPGSIAAMNGMNFVPVSTAQSIWQHRSQQLKDLGQLLKSERQAQCLTQRQVAQRAGLSETTVGRFEKHGWGSISAVLSIISALNKKITLS